MAEYNGWANYETWNVALWLGNDEGLYSVARRHHDYAGVRAELIENDVFETPDRVEYTNPHLDIAELDEAVSEL